MKTVKKIIAWVVLSSSDASKWSLTGRSVVMALIPTIITFLNLAHVNLPSDLLTQFFDTFFQALASFFAFISALGLLWGAIRKIYTTAVGENDVVNNHPLFQQE